MSPRKLQKSERRISFWLVLILIFVLGSIPHAVLAATFTCPSGYQCMPEKDAIAQWGQGNYEKYSSSVCGTSGISTPVVTMYYCFAQKASAPVCTYPVCKPWEVLYCPGQCPGGCGLQCRVTQTPTTVTPTTIIPTCPRPICEPGEVLYCPGQCPGGCGLQCMIPTTTPIAVLGTNFTFSGTVYEGKFDAGQNMSSEMPRNIQRVNNQEVLLFGSSSPSGYNVEDYIASSWTNVNGEYSINLGLNLLHRNFTYFYLSPSGAFRGGQWKYIDAKSSEGRTHASTYGKVIYYTTPLNGKTGKGNDFMFFVRNITQKTVVPTSLPCKAINQGDIVKFGDSCLNVLNAVGKNSVISWYSPDKTPGSSSPQKVVSISGTKTNFSVSLGIFNGYTGTWYRGYSSVAAFSVQPARVLYHAALKGAKPVINTSNVIMTRPSIPKPSFQGTVIKIVSQFASSFMNTLSNLFGTKPIPPSSHLMVIANNKTFDASIIAVPPNSKVDITLNNMDKGVRHNLAFYTDSSTSTQIFKGESITGPSTINYTFTTPSIPGRYYFRSDSDTSMKGILIVLNASDRVQALSLSGYVVRKPIGKPLTLTLQQSFIRNLSAYISKPGNGILVTYGRQVPNKISGKLLQVLNKTPILQNPSQLYEKTTGVGIQSTMSSGEGQSTTLTNKIGQTIIIANQPGDKIQEMHYLNQPNTWDVEQIHIDNSVDTWNSDGVKSHTDANGDRTFTIYPSSPDDPNNLQPVMTVDDHKNGTFTTFFGDNPAGIINTEANDKDGSVTITSQDGAATTIGLDGSVKEQLQGVFKPVSVVHNDDGTTTTTYGDGSYTTTYFNGDKATYDSDGNQISYEHISYDDNGNKVDTENYYNKDGTSAKSEITLDNNDNPISSVLYIFDSETKLVQSSSESWSNGHLESQTISSYDSYGDVASQTTDNYDSEGKLELQTTLSVKSDGTEIKESITFNSDEQPTSVVFENKYGDGSRDEGTGTYTDGKLSSEYIESYDDNGKLYSTTTEKYDSNGQPVWTKDERYDSNGNLVSTTETTFDSEGNETSSVTTDSQGNVINNLPQENENTNTNTEEDQNCIYYSDGSRDCSPTVTPTEFGGCWAGEDCGGIHRGGSGCFAPDTLVMTNTSLVPISNIKTGDIVLGYDAIKGTILPQTVSDTIITRKQQVLRLEFMNDSIVCSVPQPFFTGTWTRASELKAGDRVLTQDNRWEVLMKDPIPAGEIDVYNLHVIPSQSYIVGKSNLIVHNKEDVFPDEGPDDDWWD